MLSKTINGKQYLFVEIPDVEGWELRGMHSGRNYELISFYGEADAIELPKNQAHVIIGKASELTEEQWKGIVELIPQQEWDTNNLCRYKPYEGVMPYSYAKSSGLSLISSLNLKPEITLIIEKQS